VKWKGPKEVILAYNNTLSLYSPERAVINHKNTASTVATPTGNQIRQLS